MNHKYLYPGILAGIFGLTIVISLLVCRYLMVTVFFDKFFYYQDHQYGYWIPDQPELKLTDFGRRGRDLALLENSNRSPILGYSSQSQFTVAIIGDSYVWGQGLKNEDRFAHILETKLNQIQPTRIISLGGCGDNLFDHYQKYKLSEKVFGPVDLFVFALYNNDLIFNHDNRYSTPLLIQQLTQNCSGTTIFNPILNAGGPQFDPNFISTKTLSIKEDSANYCAFQKLVPLLPRQDSIYIDLGSLNENWSFQQEFNQLISRELPVISIPFNQSKSLQVSSRETHPSALANKIFARILYQEIISHPSFKLFPQ